MLQGTWLTFIVIIMCLSKMEGKSLVNSRKPLRWLTRRDVNTGWSPWSSWSKCSEKICCRHGVMSRLRNCSEPPCVGIEKEAEDCPKRNCKECSSGPLPDTTIAATGSFINTECETTKKHSGSGKLSFLIRPSVYKHFPGLKSALRSGFFALQKVYLSSHDENNKRKIVIYKFCFEPKVPLVSRQVKNVFRTNRIQRLSNARYPLGSRGTMRVNGIVITVLSSGKLFRPGVFFTAVQRNRVMAFYRYFRKT